MKPLIYVYGHPEYVEEKKGAPYIAALEAAGAEVLHTSDPADADRCCGLLITGGGDIDPALYGQENRGSERFVPLRDENELPLAAKFIAEGKPFLGICRGCQVLNVALGGTLIQDIPYHNAFENEARLHPAMTEEGSVLAELYGAGEIVINSWHHQVLDRLGEGLRVTMRSCEGYVEAVEHVSAPAIGVQWHPERLRGNFVRPAAVDGQKVFDYFVQLCREHQ